MFISFLHTTSPSVKRINNNNSKRKVQEGLEGFDLALTKEMMKRNCLKIFVEVYTNPYLRFKAFSSIIPALNVCFENPNPSGIAVNEA